MLIVHVLPFAPNRCGLYEAGRDMIRADCIAGYKVAVVDSGITTKGEHEEGKTGQVDDRAGFSIVTQSHEIINEADLLIMHTGAPDSWIVTSDCPIIWVVHGRPHACFKPEMLFDYSNSFSLYHHLSKWQRTKKMLYFWNEFIPDWGYIFKTKNCCLDYPVIDELRFTPEGAKHQFKEPGAYDFLICDSDREDIDLYPMMTSLINASRCIDGVKFHFYGFDFPIKNCYNILLNELKDLGTLGDLMPRVNNMELLYRSADCLISPNRIAVRTIGESMMCGTPVISESEHGQYKTNFNNREEVISDIKDFIQAFNRKTDWDVKSIRDYAIDCFGITNHNKRIKPVYDEVMGEKWGVKL